jgi:hypothetical protein
MSRRLGLFVKKKSESSPTNTNLIFKMSELGRSIKRNQPVIAELEERLLKHSSLAKDWAER